VWTLIIIGLDVAIIWALTTSCGCGRPQIG
jgi:hypothetical protein